MGVSIEPPSGSIDAWCFVECILGDCAPALIEYFTKVPTPSPPGGYCGLCVPVCGLCITGCLAGVTGIAAVFAAALCAGCGTCLGAEVGYCLDECDIF